MHFFLGALRVNTETWKFKNAYNLHLNLPHDTSFVLKMAGESYTLYVQI